MIAAVLLGGVSIFGGRGALHGVVAGVLLIGVLSSAMRLEGYTVNVINIVIGVLLVLSVMSTSLLAWVSSLRSARTGARGPSAPDPTAAPTRQHHQQHHREAATMKLNRRVSALAAITLIAGLGLTACGDDSDSSGDGGGGDGGGDLSITFLPEEPRQPVLRHQRRRWQEGHRGVRWRVRGGRPRPGHPRRPGAVHQHRRPAGRQRARRLGQRPDGASATPSTRPATPASRSSPSTPTPTRSAATSTSTRPTRPASPRSRST